MLYVFGIDGRGLILTIALFLFQDLGVARKIYSGRALVAEEEDTRGRKMQEKPTLESIREDEVGEGSHGEGDRNGEEKEVES